MKLSFVIPYYDVAPVLLRRCLESVRAFMSEVPQWQWEAWVVDDGSADPLVAQREADGMRCAHIKVLHPPHGGLGAARNVGLDHCTGHYVMLLDADDYLLGGTAPALLAFAQQRRPDILAYGMKKVYAAVPLPCRRRAHLHLCYEGSGAAYMARHNLRAAAWGYLIRREVLGGLRFPEGVYHEDEAFTPRLWLRARSVCVSRLPVYAYYQRPDSIVHAAGRQRLALRMAHLRQVWAGLRCEPTNDALQRRALQRRVDTLASDMWWRLLRESPDVAFWRQEEQRMRQAGCCPLPFRAYTLRYAVLCLLSRWRGTAVAMVRMWHPPVS